MRGGVGESGVEKETEDGMETSMDSGIESGEEKECEAQETNPPSQHCVTPNRLYRSITSCTDDRPTVCDTFHIYIDSVNLSLQ